MTITAGCQVTAGAVAFGSSSGIFAAVLANTTLVITCTTSTPYTVGLDPGSGIGATTAVRKMTGASLATINYRLYQNAGLTSTFGNAPGVDTAAGVGNGTAQTITIYGQVPAQTSPAPGSYSDIVNVTLTY
ncbi:MAG: spore coat U domain-containing protein [Pseudomonadota bacterium]|nr:spore coat U domain-containing protein [Pseudomonadota bacterium]